MRSRFDTLARRASSQHGRISHAQLIAAGVDRDRIKRWRSDGRLRPVYIGVFTVGHGTPSPHGDLMSALLACEHGAVVLARPDPLQPPPRAEPHRRAGARGHRFSDDRERQRRSAK